MTKNLAALSREHRDKINVDLAASGVAYRERLNLPVLMHEAESTQPAELRDYFRERLQYYRQKAQNYPRGTDHVYQKKAEE